MLAVLLLRGPQTPGELKARSERMAPFASLDAVERVLATLVERGYVRRLGRRPGQKEDRFEQLLGGADAGAPAPPVAAAAQHGDDRAWATLAPTQTPAATPTSTPAPTSSPAAPSTSTPAPTSSPAAPDPDLADHLARPRTEVRVLRRERRGAREPRCAPTRENSAGSGRQRQPDQIGRAADDHPGQGHLQPA